MGWPRSAKPEWSKPMVFKVKRHDYLIISICGFGLSLAMLWFLWQ